jgi:hypothetical protein
VPVVNALDLSILTSHALPELSIYLKSAREPAIIEKVALKVVYKVHSASLLSLSS